MRICHGPALYGCPMNCRLCNEKIPRMRALFKKSEFCCDEHADQYKDQTLNRLLAEAVVVPAGRFLATKVRLVRRTQGFVDREILTWPAPGVGIVRQTDSADPQESPWTRDLVRHMVSRHAPDDELRARVTQHLGTALGNVQTIIFVGPNRNATSEYAHILLPAAAWPEKDGTFTNFANRVQRIHKAVEPLDDARSEWQILKRLGKALGVSVPYLETGDVFAAIGQSAPAFAELNYEVIGSKGAMLKS